MLFEIKTIKLNNNNKTDLISRNIQKHFKLNLNFETLIGLTQAVQMCNTCMQ